VRVVVVGAGIGGLCTALSLHAAGITDVTVYEAVEEIRPLGVGVDLLPDAVGELARAGLYDDVAEIAVTTEEVAFHDRFGARIRTEPCGRAAGHAWPRLAVHHGELRMLLLRAQLAWLGPESLRTGLRLCGYAQTADAVTVEFADASGRIVTDEADVLIAADGVDSAGRALMYPKEAPASGSGTVLWRGTSPAPPFLSGRSMLVVEDGPHTFVAYPIREAEGQRPALVTWLAERPFDDAPPGPVEADTDDAIELDAIARHFEEWDVDGLDIATLIENADDAYEYRMPDREPPPSWSDARVTLLGDAARATSAIGSRGATRAVLDARVLARELAAGPDPVEAIAAYEQARRPDTGA